MSLLNTLTFGLLKKIVAAVVAIFFASTILAVLLFKYVPVYVTPLMVIRTMEQIKDGKTIAMHHHWVSMDKISKHLPVAVMASEDQRFLLHHGFDFNAIQKAVMHNSRGGTVHGASTISQQTLPRMFSYTGQELGAQGVGELFHVPDRDVLVEAAHHGGLPQFHRDGTGHIWC